MSRDQGELRTSQLPHTITFIITSLPHTMTFIITPLLALSWFLPLSTCTDREWFVHSCLPCPLCTLAWMGDGKLARKGRVTRAVEQAIVMASVEGVCSLVSRTLARSSHRLIVGLVAHCPTPITLSHLSDIHTHTHASFASLTLARLLFTSAGCWTRCTLSHPHHSIPSPRQSYTAPRPSTTSSALQTVTDRPSRLCQMAMPR
jgi:hypothetical protein